MSEEVVKAEANGHVEPPEMMSTGMYAIFKTPEGGWVVSYLPSDTEEEGHFQIPAVAVQLLQSMMRGEPLPNPMELVKTMMAARKGM